jgi:hypothetical protein
MGETVGKENRLHIEDDLMVVRNRPYAVVYRLGMLDGREQLGSYVKIPPKAWISSGIWWRDAIFCGEIVQVVEKS